MTRRLTPEQISWLKALPTINERKGKVQEMGLGEWHVANGHGTMELATGTGKTRIGVLAVAEEFSKNPDAIVYVCVPTQTLRDTDWPNEFRTWGYSHLLEKVKFICHVSMSDVEEITGEIDLVVFDEIHNVTNANFQLFRKNKVYKVLGLTATLPPEDGYEIDQEKLAMINAIAPSVFKITLDEAVEIGLVADFEVYVMKIDLDDKDLYVDGGTKAKPHKTTEYRRYKYLTQMLSRSAWKNPGAKFVWIQKRMAFLYTLRQKELVARDVMDAILSDKDGKAKRTLILAGSIEQCNRLCGDWVYHSKVLGERGEKKDRYLTLFQEQKIPYLGAVQALNEGKNIEMLDQLLIIQLNSKELDIVQRIGRTIRFRPGHTARVVVLVAKGTVDEDWYKKAFENFDRKRIKEYHVKPARDPHVPA